MTSRLKFNRAAKTPFYATLRARVDLYFKESGISPNADRGMWMKTLFFLSVFFGSYILIVSGIFDVWTTLCLAAILGVFSAFVGFNVCHDAIHGSFSSSKGMNRVLSWVFNLLGASPYVWSITHNAVHHTYTNIPGHDEDIDVAPGLIRISDEEPANRLQRFQHWYAFPLYSLASLSWAFRKDYKKFFQKAVGHVAVKHPKIEYFKLFFNKSIYYFLFIALPFLLLDVTWWQYLIGFLVMHFAQGLTMGLVFQLAHVVEGTDYPVPDNNGNMEEAWAEHQMRTTANFAGNSGTAAFFLGGLNMQIEHHLFPKVCHVHYRKIGAIVKDTATEFNIPYIENPTFFAALRSHFFILRKFSRQAS